MAELFESITQSGALAFAIPIALIAGLVSFFSPCVIPLLPAYLSYATGLSASELVEGEGDKRRGRMLLGSALFVLGFTLVFTIMGGLSGALTWWLYEYTREITMVLGVVVIILGLAFGGWLPFFQKDLRIHKVPAVGLGAAPLLGALFGLGWTPCVGPTLGVILTLASHTADPARGALLAFFYSLGIGIPFIIAGLAYRRAMGAFSFFRRHQMTLMRVSGALMILIGILLATGIWDIAMSKFQYAVVDNFKVAV